MSIALSARADRKRAVWPVIRGWLFVGPVVLGTLIFNVLPLFPTVYASLTTWNGLGDPRWIGLANYQKIFAGRDPVLLVSLKNTVVFTVGYVPVAIIVGLGLALIANQKLRGIVVFRRCSSCRSSRRWSPSASSGAGSLARRLA